ncbi:hypothetical protein WKR88_09195, partial [Trinickia caryophylli]|uniref:hypothetical protein n=1 Tax=Trinickia caryophylli TaxID=28094 RepID=UPI0030BE6811
MVDLKTGDRRHFEVRIFCARIFSGARKPAPTMLPSPSAARGRPLNVSTFARENKDKAQATRAG